ncbi:hypothetical protein DNU06_08125 [Putridiphycobacter roseus]|uniref:Glycosyltransferase RgtA/B/C/D-like domain-containing protein n=1 Tax=Putridiphycobacter roseus TaxID=2219161 RepID=A0A2W1N2M2_9FLAO|nr:hypothetical protein [Putridiphycobacter roseus]PZE17231.1 hypothetical protein DNU06_08125 [Putridiphycobacter roseus]
MKIKLNWYAWFSVIIVGVISAVKIIHEPDVWWQIRTGQWILAHNEVPKIDVFSYTFLNEPWINVKWFAEVLMASVNNFFGAEWLVLLQIGCITLILVYAYKLSKAINLKYVHVKSTMPKLGIMLASLLLLFTINYRMNSRPEMFSHVLVIIFLYYLFKYSMSKSKWLFLIIPLQILWTNTHEAYGMGIVLILIFLFAHWAEYLFFKKEKPLRFTLLGVLAIISTSLNPNGFKMIAHPFNIFGQLSENKFTTELLGFKDGEFWHYQAFMMLLVFAACLLFFLKKNGKTAFSLQGVIDSFGLPYILIFFAFFYLSLTAFRNIPFFMIVCTPLLASYIDVKVTSENKKQYYGVFALSLFLYGMLASNQLYNRLLPREQFGIGVNSETTPIGAAKFLKEHEIKDKGFVDYLTSAYFLYELQPEYKSFIDLRDLDVFHTEFFQNTFRVYQAPTSALTTGQTLWEYYNELDEFNYIVLLNAPTFKNLNNYLVHSDDDYELVYADNLNSIYLRRNKQNEALIQQYGFSDGKKDVYKKMTPYPNSKSAETWRKVLWPFENVKKEEKFTVIRSLYYKYIGTKAPKLTN